MEFFFLACVLEAGDVVDRLGVADKEEAHFLGGGRGFVLLTAVIVAVKVLELTAPSRRLARPRRRWR